MNHIIKLSLILLLVIFTNKSTARTFSNYKYSIIVSDYMCEDEITIKNPDNTHTTLRRPHYSYLEINAGKCNFKKNITSQILDNFCGPNNVMFLNDDLCLIGNATGITKLFDLKTKKCIWTINPFVEKIYGPELASDNLYFYISGRIQANPHNGRIFKVGEKIILVQANGLVTTLDVENLTIINSQYVKNPKEIIILNSNTFITLHETFDNPPSIQRYKIKNNGTIKKKSEFEFDKNYLNFQLLLKHSESVILLFYNTINPNYYNKNHMDFDNNNKKFCSFINYIDIETMTIETEIKIKHASCNGLYVSNIKKELNKVLLYINNFEKDIGIIKL